MRKVTTSRCVLREGHLRRRSSRRFDVPEPGCAQYNSFVAARPDRFLSKETFFHEPIHTFRDALHCVTRGSLTCAASLSAQTRLSDKDVQQHMKNLKYDAKKFRCSFNRALPKSAIGKTTQEKDAKTLAPNIEADKFHVPDLQERHQGRTVAAKLPGHCPAARQNHGQHAVEHHHQYPVVYGGDRTETSRKRL